jgi:hypothetical protein
LSWLAEWEVLILPLMTLVLVPIQAPRALAFQLALALTQSLELASQQLALQLAPKLGPLSNQEESMIRQRQQDR